MERDAIRALVALLRHSEFAVRTRADFQLAAAGDDAVPALLEELAARHPLSAPRALALLARSEAPEAVVALLTFNPGIDADLTTAWLANLRLIRGEALLRLPSRSVVAILRQRYAEGVEWLEVLQTLAGAQLQRADASPQERNLTDELYTAARNEALPESVRAALLQVVAVATIAAASAAQRIVYLRSPDPEFRRAASQALAREGEASVPALAAELARRDPNSLAPAAAALGAIGGRVAAQTLLGALAKGGRAMAELDDALAGALSSVADSPERADLELLTDVVARHARAQRSADVAAQALERLARSDPFPELRRALAPLRGSVLRVPPKSFASAARAIRAATERWASLPLPAEGPGHGVDLPRPAEEPDGP